MSAHVIHWVQVLKNDLVVVLKNDSNFNLWRSTDLVIFPTHLPFPLFVHYQCIFLYDTCWSVWICMFMTEKRSPWTDVNLISLICTFNQIWCRILCTIWLSYALLKSIDCIYLIYTAMLIMWDSKEKYLARPVIIYGCNP